MRALRGRLSFAALVPLLASCSLIFPGSDYRDSSGAGAAGGATGIGGSGDGGVGAQGDGGSGATGAGGEAPDTVARVFVATGDRDKPPAIPGSFDTATYDVMFTDVRADGSLAPWRFTTPLPLSGSVPLYATADKLYAFGRSGDVDSSDRGVLMGAPLTEDGVGGWTVSVDPDIYQYDTVTPAFSGGFGYLLGGATSNPTTYYADAVVLAVDLEATTLAAHVSTTPLATARRSIGTFAKNGFLYLIGGYNGAHLPIIEIATIADGGQLEWIGTPQDLPGQSAGTYGVSSPTLCEGGGRLYVVGGNFSNGKSDLVVVSDMNPTTGELTDWRYGQKMSAPLLEPGCFVWENRLYVLGGEGNSGRYDTVRVAELDAMGVPTSWDDDFGPTLPYPRSDMEVLVVTAQ